MPLSGAMDGYKGDLSIEAVIGGSDSVLKGEVKARKAGAGFKTIMDWKGDNEFLFLIQDRTEPLVVIDIGLFTKIATGEIVLVERDCE